jgi:hypothetical protein
MGAVLRLPPGAFNGTFIQARSVSNGILGRFIHAKIAGDYSQADLLKISKRLK